MILYVILMFSLAAAIGLFMVVLGLRYHKGSLVLGLSHAAIATSALVILVVEIFHQNIRHVLFNDAALVLLMTFGGGLVMLALREGRKPPPMVVVGIHAAMALFAILLLIIGYRQG